jgi:hypothetical protein
MNTVPVVPGGIRLPASSRMRILVRKPRPTVPGRASLSSPRTCVTPIPSVAPLQERDGVPQAQRGGIGQQCGQIVLGHEI